MYMCRSLPGPGKPPLSQYNLVCTALLGMYPELSGHCTEGCLYKLIDIITFPIVLENGI